MKQVDGDTEDFSGEDEGPMHKLCPFLDRFESGRLFYG